MGWCRFSSLDRVLNCPGHLTLPEGPDPRSASVKEAAAWGTMVHSWKATGAIPEPQEGYENLPGLFRKKLTTCWGKDEAEWEGARLALWPSDGLHEVSVALTTRAEGAIAWAQDQDQDEWTLRHGDEVITGHIDYLGDVFDDPWIDDLKTGRWPVHPSAPQLLGYSLAGWWIREKRSRIVYSSVTHWTRYPVKSLPQRTMIEVSSTDLDDLFRRLVRLREKVVSKDENIRFKAGSHCRFCTRRTDCVTLKRANDDGESW